MFGKLGKRRGGLSEEHSALVVSAARALRLAEPKWTHEGALFEFAGRSEELTARSMRRAVSRRNHEQAAQDPELRRAIGLAAELGVQPPTELMSDFGAVREMLLPRLFASRELSGPRRGMCRRETFGGLMHAVVIAEGAGAPVVTTPMLDQWPVPFEEVMELASENFVNRLGPDSLESLDGAPQVRALLDARTFGSGGAVALDVIAEEWAEEHGVVFSTPREEALLLLPVEAGAGAEGLGALVNATQAMVAGVSAALCDQVFWWRPDGVVHLPMTTVVEKKSRRVQMEAKGALEELLRVLGVVD